MNVELASDSIPSYCRHAGDVLQFHSFYRDVRNMLAGANGWRAEVGGYAIDVDEEY